MAGKVDGQQQQRLAITLSGIWASELPLSEKRRLATRCTMATFGLGAGSKADDDTMGGQEVLHTFEDALEVVGKAAGVDKVSVKDAKLWLRSHGMQDMAAQLGRLSSVRNTLAHPKLVAFMRHLAEQLASMDTASEP